MRILQSHEISTVCGADFGDDLGEALGEALAPLFLILCSTWAGGAAGHIAGSIGGYQLAHHFGATTAMSYLSGFGVGIAGLAVGFYGTALGGAWLLETLYEC